MQGLTKETAHTLKFTVQSTYLYIIFLLQQAGFYYVLSRSLSSPDLQQNPLISCLVRKTELCVTINQTVAKPVLDNICLQQNDSLKRKIICNKPLSRKVLFPLIFTFSLMYSHLTFY